MLGMARQTVDSRHIASCCSTNAAVFGAPAHRPAADLERYTTWKLIEDMEVLRWQLQVDHWLVLEVPSRGVESITTAYGQKEAKPGGHPLLFAHLLLEPCVEPC